MHGGKVAVKLFGVTAEGYSVMLHVTDFKHYLYVAAPISFQGKDCALYKAYLETQVAQHQPAIHSVSLTLREDIYHYQGNVQSPYLKITVTDPRFINTVRSTIEKGFANWKGMWGALDGGLRTYDNIQYVLRFMVDCKVIASLHAGLWDFLANKLCARFKACRGWKPCRLLPDDTGTQPPVQLPD